MLFDRLVKTTCGLAAAFSLIGAGAVQAATAASAKAPGASKPVPMFLRGRSDNPDIRTTPGAGLPLWTYSWNYNGGSYNGQMVGAVPSTGTSTTVPVFVVPIKLIIQGQTFDPAALQSNGQTATNDIINSPIFQTGVDFVEGGVNIGNTQYIDAFQRANFWKQVKAHPGYHVLLGAPTVLPTLTIKVPSFYGTIGTPFGQTVGEVDFGYIDAQFQKYIAKNPQITASTLPIFVTYNTYLTSGGCCIGGYHWAINGAQTYSHFTWISQPGNFSQDVSALSHEIGEWMDDPLANSTANPCGGLLETGDPEEGDANYGGFPYNLGGFTYNLQDLTFITYFGAPKRTSLLRRTTFQGNPLTVCQNGQ